MTDTRSSRRFPSTARSPSSTFSSTSRARPRASREATLSSSTQTDTTLYRPRSRHTTAHCADAGSLSLLPTRCALPADHPQPAETDLALPFLAEPVCRRTRIRRRPPSSARCRCFAPDESQSAQERKSTTRVSASDHDGSSDRQSSSDHAPTPNIFTRSRSQHKRQDRCDAGQARQTASRQRQQQQWTLVFIIRTRR